MFLEKIDQIKSILDVIHDQGGIAYLVGGTVRDLVLDRPIKDIDIEVHNISMDDLLKILQKFGYVLLIGKQFGVLKLHKFDIDWSLPRKDSVGRKPEVIVDPDLSIQEACKRRDVTMNAMAINLKDFDTEKILDFYGGLKDIQDKILRAVDENRFIDDPLRFYRVMQFVGRFEMTPDKNLQNICKAMDLTPVSKGGELARERIYEEIRKLLLKSQKPSLGFRWVKKLSRLKELFPELGALDGVYQREDYHPEGDAFEHTMQSLDAAAALEMDDEEKFLIMLSILCHDLGKAVTSDEKGHSRGHDVAGVPLAKTFLKRFTWDSTLIRSVCKLVRYHRSPLTLVEQKSSSKAYKRLAKKLSPEVTAKQLYWVAWCDVRGRNANGTEPLTKGLGEDDIILETFLEKVKGAQVEEGPEEPVLLGRHLLDLIEPGPELGKILKEAYEIQIEEDIRDIEELKKRVLVKRK